MYLVIDNDDKPDSEGCFLELRINAVGEAVIDEGEAITLVELVLELHPMQTQSV